MRLLVEDRRRGEGDGRLAGREERRKSRSESKDSKCGNYDQLIGAAWQSEEVCGCHEGRHAEGGRRSAVASHKSDI